MATTVNSYIEAAERAAAARRRSDPAWVERARRDALARFEALGFPTTRDEEWRFTGVTPIAEARFLMASDGTRNVGAETIAPFEWEGSRTATLVFVNGRYAAAASDVAGLPPGVRVENLAAALGDPVLEPHLTHLADANGHAFAALNTAFLADGAFVFLPDSAVVERPIHLLFLAVPEPEPTMAHPRVLVVAGRNSQATVVESYASLGAERYLTNVVTEIVAGENATLHHYKVQQESLGSFHVGLIYVRTARDASVASHSISLGGALVRNEVTAVLDGEGATCTLNGLYVAGGSRFVDNHTTIVHARANCASREVYKGILADRSRAVFNGKILVRPDAQKTDAKQTNKALLLSEDAQINTKPQLEIFANDVKCTHGAAVGQMDDEAIFYMRARGIGERAARQMLVRAFAADVLNQMPLEALRARIDDELLHRLSGLGG